MMNGELETGAAVVSVNAGAVRNAEWQGRRFTTAIFKEPLRGKIAVRGINVAGDDQADRKAHGGYDQALYAYASEDYAWWSTELGSAIEIARFGENLTTRGIALGDALVGERWRIGSAVLEVSQPRIPCFKLAMRMNDQGFVRRFARALRPGTYLRIVTEGEIEPGDSIEVVFRPAHALSVRELTRIRTFDHAQAVRLLDVPALSDGWRAWAHEHIAQATRESA